MRGKILLYILATVLLARCSTMESPSSETVKVFYVNKFGAVPDDGKDDTPAIQAALDLIKRMKKPVILRFAGGTYDFFATSAVKTNYPITAIHKQWDFVTPFHLDEIGDLTIDGGNSIFLIHGRMTPFVLNACENIKISKT